MRPWQCQFCLSELGRNGLPGPVMNRSFGRRVRKILLRSSEREAGFARTEQMPTSNRHGSAMLLLKCKPMKHPGFTPSRLLTRAEMALCELTQAFLSGLLPATTSPAALLQVPPATQKYFLQSNHYLLLFISGLLHVLFPGLECARPGNLRAQLMCCLLQEDFSDTPCLQRKTKFEKLGEVALLQAQPVLLNFLSPSWSPCVESFHLNVHCSTSLEASRGRDFSGL